MNNRTDQAAAAVETGISDGAPDGVTPRPLPVAQPRPMSAPQSFGLSDFVAGDDTRLRDLLAFGMAVEAGRVPGPDGIPDLRRKADAELEAHAFRVLHNQAEQIRRQAVDDQLARMPRGLSFIGAALASAVGIVLFLAALAILWLAAPTLVAELPDYLAQLAARLHPGT